MRCFLAIPLRPPAQAAAQQVLEQLRTEVTEVRWARPETLHITLHFFGPMDDERVAVALDAVRPVLNASRPFDVVIDRLGSFPERDRPRVLWLGSTREARALHILAGSVRHRLRQAAFEVDARPFRAHVTLGRPRVPWPRDARAAWETAVSRGLRPAAFVADHAVLYESVTSRDAPVYLERAALSFTSDD